MNGGGRGDSWDRMGEYRVHPYASIFPLIPDSELSGLAADIKQNGLREAIVLANPSDDSDEWVIIDGRNRFRACEQAGVRPRFETNHMDPAKIGPWIVSHNLHRRHLTVSQRAVVAVEYERIFAEEAKKRQIRKPADSVVESLPQQNAPKASDEAGDLFNVSGRSVRDAKYVANKDSAAFERVMAGDVAVSAAAKKLRGNAPPKPKREVVTNGNPSKQVGTHNSKKQLNILDVGFSQLRGVAEGLSIHFKDGFERTCTPAVAADFEQKYRAELTRIEDVLGRLSAHGSIRSE